jgi:tetratricopeptide (TPR) repeat protein
MSIYPPPPPVPPEPPVTRPGPSFPSTLPTTAIGPALLALCLAALAGFNTLAYRPSFRAPFVFDDRFNILENSDVIRVGLGGAPLLALADPRLQARRPLAFLTFALNLRAFGQDPFSFHVVNLAIHVLDSWLLFALILSLSQGRRGGFQTRSYLPALAGALLWSLHPVQVQAVTYIVQRMASLAALFYLLALLLWLQTRGQPRRLVRVGWFLAALLSAWLGFETKETVVTLPLAVLLLEGVVPGRERTRGERRAWLGKAALALAGYGLLLLAVVPRLSWDIADNVTHLSADWTTRLWNQPAVIWHYLSLLAFPLPSRLSLDPEWVSASGLRHPWSALPALLALAALIGAGLYSIRVRPLAAGAGFFFLLTLLPESMVPLDPVFYHRLYLPSTLLLGVIGAGLARSGRFRKARLALLALCLAGLGLLTYTRNTDFHDELRIWRDTVKKSPHQARAWANLAAVYEAESPARALQFYLAALRQDPRNLSANINLTYLYLNSNHLAQAREAAQHALALKPNHPLAMLAKAAVEAKTGNPDAALEWFRRVWETKPADPGVLEKLGQGLVEMNRPDLAQDVYDKFLSLFPNLSGNYLLLGNALFYQGRFQEAAAAYEEELARDPRAGEALNNLGMARLRLGETQKARDAFARATALAPGAALYQENLCDAELQQNRLGAAEAACRQALALDPGLELCRKMLQEISRRKRNDE